MVRLLRVNALARNNCMLYTNGGGAWLRTFATFQRTVVGTIRRTGIS